MSSLSGLVKRRRGPKPQAEKSYQDGVLAGKRLMRKAIAMQIKPVVRDTQQNRICAAAKNVDEALVLWKISSCSLYKEVVKIIPNSESAWHLYRRAQRGEEPLCNYIRQEKP